jgi:GcrA cell cycle regulator
MDWTEQLIARLRALWAEGHSTAEIGRRMGISKNAVVGKAHRLQLPARPSPIQRGEPMPARRPSAAARRAAARPNGIPPQGEDLAGSGLAGSGLPPRGQSEARSPAPPTQAAPALRTVQPAAGRNSTRSAPCCWPIGEPGSPGFRFCDEPAVAGKPYCEAHVQLAYVKVRDRREDAA